jgi:hypothetical protein
MSRWHATLESHVRRLRRSPESLAAAAALNDPGPLLQLEAERLRHGRLPSDAATPPPVRPTPP